MSELAANTARTARRHRLRLDVVGVVQGVGFRPFVHRLAASEGLAGFVCNTPAGASVEVEGPRRSLERFIARLRAEIAPPADIHEWRPRRLRAQGENEFVIAASAAAGPRGTEVVPDLATCSACLGEILDPRDRRYRYPFTTCAQCGPRYSIIESVPYDRDRTTMRRFVMCAACAAEYADQRARRFHAETTACPECGPQLALWDPAGKVLATGHEALTAAADALRDGRIVALKGIGGFQLLVDASNEPSLRRLRELKMRPAKPFAVMVPALVDALAIADVSADEARLLCSPAAPIVLLRTRANGRRLAAGVAPGAGARIGLMLPYSPLHHLLMRELACPLVATSGNRGDQPIVFREDDALERLAGLADFLLVHDRPISRPVDDSVVRMIEGRETILRLARGYAPLSLAYPTARTSVLAVGGHQKNAVAVAVRDRVVLGPHIGDLDGVETRTAFARAVDGVTTLYDVRPQLVACDLHPSYHSTRIAERLGPPLRRVQHHLAHTLSGMIDNGLTGPVLGVAWDGTGHGGDGTIWGGEFLAIGAAEYRRVASLAPFRLPGGAAAIREPRRTAVGALYAIFGEAALAMTDLPPVAACTPAERPVLARMLARGVNAPVTTSAGRLFDAVAAILAIRQTTSFEGEAAMALELAAGESACTLELERSTVSEGEDRLVVDWRPTLTMLVGASRSATAPADLAAAFHEALADAIVAVALRVGIAQVLLTGGCFQNARLTQRTAIRLRHAGFTPYWHHRVPPNDGGLAAGQASFALRPLIENH